MMSFWKEKKKRKKKKQGQVAGEAAGLYGSRLPFEGVQRSPAKSIIVGQGWRSPTKGVLAR